MKAALTLMVLFGSISSFADSVRIDPAYVDNGVYTQMDPQDQAEAIYNGDIQHPVVIEIQTAAGGQQCNRHTPVGVPCLCSGGVYRGRDFINTPGWHADERMHAVRDGWHVTYLKGQHGGGISCMRDRMGTSEERARFMKTGR